VKSKEHFRYVARGFWTGERTDRLIALYTAGMGPMAIAEAMSLRVDQVNRRLARLVTEGRIVRRDRRRITDEVVRDLHQGYWNDIQSLGSAAALVGITGEALRQRFLKLELPIRESSDERALAARRSNAVQAAEQAREAFVQTKPPGQRDELTYATERLMHSPRWPAQSTLMRHLGVSHWHEVVSEPPPPQPPTLRQRAIQARAEFMEATASAPQDRRSITYMRLREEHYPHWPHYVVFMRVFGGGSFVEILTHD
jgi:hypothetical protein